MLAFLGGTGPEGKGLALRLAAAGEPYAWYAVVGLVVNIVVLWLLLRRFNIILHR